MILISTHLKIIASFMTSFYFFICFEHIKHVIFTSLAAVTFWYFSVVIILVRDSSYKLLIALFVKHLKMCLGKNNPNGHSGA